MTRPLQARVHPTALLNNLLVVRNAAPTSKIMAVIKANGYGHGMLRVARALESADGYAVLSLADAIALRQMGFRQQILLLEGFFEPQELSAIAEQRITVVIHSNHQIDALDHAWLPVRIDCYLKINTGMNRLGFAPRDFPDVLARLKQCKGVGNISLMTHFASADEPTGISSQTALFDQLTEGLSYPKCLANSAAILRYPESHQDWIRPGIMLYGASPFVDQSSASLGLEPAMTLATELIAVQKLKAEDKVGYGGTFVADKEMRIGIVACGYADGYPRHAGTGTPVLVSGKRTRTLGRVSMDMMYADITDIPEAGIGSEVILWGEGLPVEEVAKAAGTISYELLTARADRVPVVEV